MNTFIWFTFNERLDALYQSMRSVAENVRAAKRFCIVFDALNIADPVPTKALILIEAIREKYGIECLVRTSTFDREINLNGYQCLRGMLDTYVEFSDNSDAIFKIDEDTMVFKDNYINKFLSGDEYLSLGCRRKIVNDFDLDRIHGCVYAMKSVLIKNINREVNHAISFEGYIDSITEPDSFVAHNLVEDRTFSMIIKNATSDFQRLWVPFVLGCGFFAGWQYKNKTYANAYKHYDAITYGNRGLVPYVDGMTTNEVISMTMKETLDEFLKTKP